MIDPRVLVGRWVVNVNKLLGLIISLRSRRLEVVGTRKNGRARRRHARSLFRPLLPSACYAGYLIIDGCLKANLSMLSGVVAHIGRVRDAILDRFAKEFNSDVDFHAFRGPLVISPTIVLVYLLSFSLRYVERSFW